MGHFAALEPVCPTCRANDAAHPLRVAEVAVQEADTVLEGILHCSNPQCQREYPILDGIPFLLAGIRSYVSDNLSLMLMQGPSSESLEGLLGDCAGPGSWFDTLRQHLSSYAWDHYGDLDPQGSPGPTPPGALVELLERHVFPQWEPLPAGPLLDLGCGPGRSTFALAARYQRPVVGIDLHLGMIRFAQRVLRTGQVQYPLRRVGLVYDRRQYAASLAGRELVDFWVCDALALPFPPDRFAAALCLNTLDSVQSPAQLLQQVDAALAPQGRLAMACPYDWSASVTPLEAWIGGHSQRSAQQGAPEPLLRQLLTPGAHPESVRALRVLAEQDDVPWQVRMHARGTMHYRLHLVIAGSLKQSRT